MIRSIKEVISIVLTLLIGIEIDKKDIQILHLTKHLVINSQKILRILMTNA